jgi:hypothetical protein
MKWVLKMRTFLPVYAHVLTAFLTAFPGRRLEKTRPEAFYRLNGRRFYKVPAANGISIWRINKNLIRIPIVI